MNTLPTKAHEKQIDGLQILRAAAVISVCWLHSGQILETQGHHRLPDVGVFGIDLFFVISGFILSLTVLRIKTRHGLKTAEPFFVRRVLRIYPIYWVVLVVLVIRLAFAHGLAGHDFLSSVLLTPSTGYPSGPLILGYSWTLVFEMTFYTFLSLILLFVVKQAVPTLITILVLLVAAGPFIGIHQAGLIVWANPILLEFVFGAVIALSYKQFGRRVITGRILLTLGFLGVLGCALHPLGATGMQMIMTDSHVFSRVFRWGLAGALIVAGTVFWSPATENRIGRILVFQGNASYSTYLTSGLVLEVLARILLRSHMNLDHAWAKIAFQTGTVLGAMIFGAVCYLVVERPMTKKLSRLT